MKRKIFVMLMVAVVMLSFMPMGGGEAILKMMFARYAGKWHHTLMFNQTTEVYRNDSLKRKQTWHEIMLGPDKLRIDIEPVDAGNTILFRGDSTYRFSGGVLKSAVKQENDLIFLLGGMYSMPFDKTMSKLKELGYDVTRSHEDTWKGQPVYVIGAVNNQEAVNQLWIDKANLYLVRMIEIKNNTKEEALFENQVKVGTGWSETKCSFYFNDKLAQVESYYDVKEAPQVDGSLFDPQHYAKLPGKN